MDLHTWITARVDAVEASALRGIEGRSIAFESDLDGRAVAGTITTATHGSDGLQFAIAQYGVEPRDATPAPVQQAAAVLRRCEADRRILARHTRVDSGYRVAREGCGYDGGYCPDLITENINDCPELLDLGYAHGLTPEILAGLDRPAPPERETSGGGLSGFIPDLWAKQVDAFLQTTLIRDVPPALRGPNWKADQS